MKGFMDNLERRDRQMLYVSDDAVFQEQFPARRLTFKLNTMDPSDFAGITEICRELFPNVESAFVNPPFHCDYGTHIYAGKNFYMNYNGTILDVSKVVIGDNFLAGPNVSIYSASHPMHPATRNSGFELGLDVMIGDNVWVGGNTVICAGVTIGSNVVIGAGSVVTRDIPDWSFAAGNPCRVIRPITEADREYYGHGQQIDAEAMKQIRALWAEHPGDLRFPTAPKE